MAGLVRKQKGARRNQQDKQSVYPDGPCQGCGAMMSRRGSRHLWCDACVKERQRARRK
jgi:hypothetical protein